MSVCVNRKKEERTSSPNHVLLSQALFQCCIFIFVPKMWFNSGKMHFYGSCQALWSDVYIYLPSTSKIWKCGSFCIFVCLLTLQAWNWKETTTAGLSSCSSPSPFVKLPLEPLSSLCVAALIHRADRSSGKQWASPLLTLRCWHFKWKKKQAER